MIYTCVSQGPTQRWRIQNEGGIPFELILTRTEEPGIVNTNSLYTFTLVSTDSNHFESTVEIVVTASIIHTVLECTGGTLRDTVTIWMAGHY